jgi:hypothetical protein
LPAFAPQVIILSDVNINDLKDEPTRPYWKHWWVFRPDGKDIASIDFKGDASPGVPSSRGRVYQLTIGRIDVNGTLVTGAVWPASQATEENQPILDDDIKVRHLGSLETHSDGQFDTLEFTSKRFEIDGSFQEFMPGVEPETPWAWTNVRVRARSAETLAAIAAMTCCGCRHAGSSAAPSMPWAIGPIRHLIGTWCPTNPSRSARCR